MTKFCAKGTEVSPMGRTSYDFEKYGVLKNFHSRRGDTRSVKLMSSAKSTEPYLGR